MKLNRSDSTGSVLNLHAHIHMCILSSRCDLVVPPSPPPSPCHYLTIGRTDLQLHPRCILPHISLHFITGFLFCIPNRLLLYNKITCKLSGLQVSNTAALKLAEDPLQILSFLFDLPYHHPTPQPFLPHQNIPILKHPLLQLQKTDLN